MGSNIIEDVSTKGNKTLHRTSPKTPLRPKASSPGNCNSVATPSSPAWAKRPDPDRAGRLCSIGPLQARGARLYLLSAASTLLSGASRALSRVFPNLHLHMALSEAPGYTQTPLWAHLVPIQEASLYTTSVYSRILVSTSVYCQNSDCSWENMALL